MLSCSISVSTLIRPHSRMRHEVLGPGRWAYAKVSTLIRPHSRMRPRFLEGRDANSKVSTLIRPHSRMRPSPDGRKRLDLGCFNPHPTSQPDATTFSYYLDAYEYVSTLIRPHSRMRQLCYFPLLRMSAFQPSSDLTAGCDVRAFASGQYSCGGFNPHPTSQPDATIGLQF